MNRFLAIVAWDIHVDLLEKQPGKGLKSLLKPSKVIYDAPEGLRILFNSKFDI